MRFRAPQQRPRLSRAERRWLNRLTDEEMGALVRGLVRVERAVRASRQQPTTFDPPARRRA